jgi:hypothetical protein
MTHPSPSPLTADIQPEAITELCRELGLPCRTNGYRYW